MLEAIIIIFEVTPQRSGYGTLGFRAWGDTPPRRSWLAKI